MKFVTLVAASFAIAAPALSQQGPALKVGRPAPAISVQKWIKGAPVTAFARGKVYVVEFWATWCGPCKVSIPHLTEMAHKLAGKVTFVGVSVWERGADIPGLVTKFVAGMGAKMDYTVALDTTAGAMAKTWMQAAGQNGIPTAFVVGRTGQIEWIGHPMDNLDKVLAQVLAGKFDRVAASKAREAAEEQSRKMEKLMAPIQQAAQKGDMAGALKLLDKVLADEPKLITELAPFRLNLVMRADEPAAMGAIKKMAEGAMKDNPMQLNWLAWTIVDEQAPLKTRDYALAETIAARAAELSKGVDPSILDTLAVAQFKGGKLDEAIATETKAVAALAGAQVPEEMKTDIKKRLAEYKAKKG